MLEGTMPGFRKGVNKRKLVNSLSDEDWEHIDDVKKAEERVTNDYSYRFFIESDQAVQAKDKLLADTISNTADLLAIDYITTKNEVDIEKGGREKSDSEDGASIQELKINNLKNSSQSMRIIGLLKKDLARLYTFVGRQGLDRKVFLEEEEYNDFTQDIVRKLETSRFKLV